MAKRIFIDLDGVVADWEGQALNCLGLNVDEVKEKLKSGMDLEKLVPNMWEELDKHNGTFWTELDIYPWAQELYSKMQQYGDVAFLSSGGNIHRRTKGVGIANYGKTQWVAKYFPGSSLILTREKYLCANPKAILIDDTEKKINQFVDYGGQGYLFPHAFKLLDGDLDIGNVLGELENKIKRM